MIIGLYDGSILFILGMVAAFLHKNWLYARNPDGFTISQGIVVLFWAQAAIVWTTDFLPWAGVFPSADVHPLAAIMYTIAYLFLFRGGAELMFMFHGRKPSQGGIFWLYQLHDYTTDFDPRWRKQTETTS